MVHGLTLWHVPIFWQSCPYTNCFQSYQMVEENRSVGNANFCISDTPVFINHLIRMETVDIREFPPEVSLGHFFDGLTK
ncbi:MAG: hypothetical protein LC657_06655, partial [Desulfobacteraceae bacterium]|nr:hypothetical protein [Desulfobacteraceae bacterium]